MGGPWQGRTEPGGQAGHHSQALRTSQPAPQLGSHTFILSSSCCSEDAGVTRNVQMTLPAWTTRNLQMIPPLPSDRAAPGAKKSNTACHAMHAMLCYAMLCMPCYAMLASLCMLDMAPARRAMSSTRAPSSTALTSACQRQQGARCGELWHSWLCTPSTHGCAR